MKHRLSIFHDIEQFQFVNDVINNMNDFIKIDVFVI